jgi:hypothetical protein
MHQYGPDELENNIQHVRVDFPHQLDSIEGRW